MHEISIPPAPRRVSASLRCRLLFGGIWNGLGWGFLGLGGVLSVVFVGRSTLLAGTSFSGELGRTDGFVTAVEPTSFEENERKVQRVTFGYTVDGVAHESVGYTTGHVPSPGSPLEVEYRVDDPAIARAKGLRTHVFSAVVAFVLLFPAVGAVLVLFGLRKGARETHLLAHASATTAEVVSVEPTNVRINGRPVHAVRLRYATETDVPTEGVVRTLDPAALQDDPREWVLFDPAWPERVLAVDVLPGRARFTEDGVAGSVWGFASVLLPLASAVAIALTVSLGFG